MTQLELKCMETQMYGNEDLPCDAHLDRSDLTPWMGAKYQFRRVKQEQRCIPWKVLNM